jgi:hypothetical protein
MYLTGTAIGLALAGASAQADMKDPLPDRLSLGEGRVTALQEPGIRASE